MSRRPAGWAGRFTLGVVLWLVPVTVVWLLLTPFYNRFLTRAGERLTRLTERPAVTRLVPEGRHHFVVTRTDLPSSRGWLYSVRVTDVHFPVVLLAAFFLAVPGVPWRPRLRNLGWALLLAAPFHVVSVLFWVKFVYATQLGDWSAHHYGTFGQTFWGLGKHLLDLPFKFALPLLLWSAFYLPQLRGDPEERR